MTTLKKYKKNELIDLIYEYESEINNLKVDITSLKIDLESKNDNVDIEDKTIMYLIKRIKTISCYKRKLNYVNELNRLKSINSIS